MSRKEKLEELFSRLNADLNLKADQQSSLRQIVADHLTQRKAAASQHKDNPAARKEAVRPLNQKLRQDIGAVLDAAQKKIFQSNKEAYRDLLRD